jgi:hypothetical protein
MLLPWVCLSKASRRLQAVTVHLLAHGVVVDRPAQHSLTKVGQLTPDPEPRRTGGGRGGLVVASWRKYGDAGAQRHARRAAWRRRRQIQRRRAACSPLGRRYRATGGAGTVGLGAPRSCTRNSVGRQQVELRSGGLWRPKRRGEQGWPDGSGDQGPGA